MREIVRYKTIYFSRYFGEFIFYSLLTVYLKDKGFSGTQVGAVLSFAPIILALSLPLWLMFDNGKSRKLLILTAVFLIIGLEFSLLFIKIFSVLAAIMVVYSVARAPLSSSLDSMTYVYCVENNQHYSGIRIYGSAGYIAAMLLGSYLYPILDYIWIAIISSAFMLFFLVLFLRSAPLIIDKSQPQKKDHDFKLLFRNKEFLVFLLIQTGLNALLNLNCSYDILYQQSRGMSTSMFGVTTFVRVTAEIIALSLLHKMKVPFRYLYLSVPFLILAQSVIYFFGAPVWSMFLVLISSGAASGILLYLGNRYISIIVRPRNITMANYTYVIAANLVMAICLFSGGVIMDIFNVQYIYLFSGIGFAVFSFFVMAFVHKDPVPKTD
jgi:PPP family 3-phenylpropionic acid transporter